MLSNKDIVKELGKNIYIYPLAVKNIKGASINLTASTMAWSSKTKKTIVTDKRRIIVIPPHDTGLILTNEIVCVSSKIAGTYHSRVKNASQGLGHIGTTLNPGWIGRSLIAMHNHTNDPIFINVGDPFVTITFYYLSSKSSIMETNDPQRKDILQDFQLNDFERNQIYENDLSKDVNKLKQKLLQSAEFKNIKPRFNWNITIFILLILILLIQIYVLCQVSETKVIYKITDHIIEGYIGFLLASIGFNIKKK